MAPQSSEIMVSKRKKCLGNRELFYTKARDHHSKNPKYLAAYTAPTPITSSPKKMVIHFPNETYLSPILPPTAREKVAMGMMGTPCPTPKMKSIMPPVRGVTFCDAIHIKTGRTIDRAQGAQPRAKKMPNVKAPMKAECLESSIDASTDLCIRLFPGSRTSSLGVRCIREVTGSMISSKGLILAMPRRIIMPPAMRSKIRESRKISPT